MELSLIRYKSLVVCRKVRLLVLRLARTVLVWGFREFLAIFRKHLAPIFLLLRNVRPVYLHEFAYIFTSRFALFKLLDGLKIHDIK